MAPTVRSDLGYLEADDKGNASYNLDNYGTDLRHGKGREEKKKVRRRIICICC
jgi:hypothetical protein